MRKTITVVATMFVVAIIALPTVAFAAHTPIIMNTFGYLYEDGGFPPSNPGDKLAGAGVISSAAPPINCDISTNELTWSIKGLVSQGQSSPDGGKTLIMSYTGGTIGIYCDPSNNHFWGTNPPNATSPSTFEDGAQFLLGSFSQFVMVYFPAFKVGSFQGIVSFTTGTNLANLNNPNGMIFMGTVGPQLDPQIPAGYHLQGVGSILAPALCTVKGNVSYVFDPQSCVKCKGVTELVLDYTGGGNINTATLDKGTLTIDGNQLIITPETGQTKLPSNIVVGVGSDIASIHTSCSQPIDEGNVIGKFTIASVNKILIPCVDDENCEGITRMVLLYFGPGNTSNVVVSDGAFASVSGDTITVLPTGTKLKSNTTINVDGDEATIHTSCSQPIDVGFVYGNYEIIELDKIPAGGATPPPPTSGPVVGATVDVVDGLGNMFSTLTDENGNYCFVDVAAETIKVSIEVPLGYIPRTQPLVTGICQGGDTLRVNFVLERKALQDKVRSVGFWKHQVISALRGKTKGVKHTGAELLALLSDVHTRFDVHFHIFDDVLNLQGMREVLEHKFENKRKATQYDKARSQFLALLLNVVSGRLGTWQFISLDNATVSQAITYIGQLLTDFDPVNDQVAKNIADTIVNDKKVGAGVIPLSIPQIAYIPPEGLHFDYEKYYRERKQPFAEASASAESGVLKLSNHPNPFNPVTTIRYELTGESPVTLTIYNIAGQRVRDLVRGELQKGVVSVMWDGADNNGREVASGIYFYRLKVSNQVVTKRMVLLR